LPKKDLNEATVRSKYYPFIKYSIDANTGEKNTKYEPNMKAKLSTKENQLTCELYDENLNLINLDEIPNLTEYTKRSYIIPLIDGAGLWLAAGSFGSTWRANKIIILPAENASYSFVPDGADEYMITSSHEEGGESVAKATAPTEFSFVTDKSDEDVVVEEDDEIVVDSDMEA
jgi:hypothetical protein